MDKTRLQELAGIPVTLTEGNVKRVMIDAVSDMADMFEDTLNKLGANQSDADGWVQSGKTLMQAFKEELKSRGLYE